MEIETIKKPQTEGILKTENLGKRTETTDVSITKRRQETEEIISHFEDITEEIDSTVTEPVKYKILLTQNTQEI